jgi:hypothetical protein
MANAMTEKELQLIQEAWPSFMTLSTARWRDLAERLLATTSDLQAALQQAQEELANTRCPVHKRHWSVCALMAEQAEIDLPAAIERGKLAYKEGELWSCLYLAALAQGRQHQNRAEAKEQRALAVRMAARLTNASRECHSHHGGARQDWGICQAPTCLHDRQMIAAAEAQEEAG